ncbi:MAG: GNAT family N-acetyltransferase [Hyphomicrobiales bacterium]|nr:GNAT family N-acetyltransferase [Hyphomicrobiales bacterium]
MFPNLFRDDVFTLETPRLFLRWPKAGDARAILELAGEKVISEMTGIIPHPYPPEAAPRYIVDAREWNSLGSRVKLAITDRAEPGRFLGMVGLRATGPDEAALGYWLGRPHWGQGRATEAAQALIDAAFLYSPVKALAASVRVINPASRRVLERCGFQLVGSDMLDLPAWGGRVPVESYRLPRALWQSLKGWRAPLPVRRELAEEGAA